MKPETKNMVDLALGQVKTADDVRALINAIWAITHDTSLTDKQLIEGLCLLSGVACAALIDYASMLDDERVEIGESQDS